MSGNVEESDINQGFVLKEGTQEAHPKKASRLVADGEQKLFFHASSSLKFTQSNPSFRDHPKK